MLTYVSLNGEILQQICIVKFKSGTLNTGEALDMKTQKKNNNCITLVNTTRTSSKYDKIGDIVHAQSLSLRHSLSQSLNL